LAGRSSFSGVPFFYRSLYTRGSSLSLRYFLSSFVGNLCFCPLTVCLAFLGLGLPPCALLLIHPRSVCVGFETRFFKPLLVFFLSVTPFPLLSSLHPLIRKMWGVPTERLLPSFAFRLDFSCLSCCPPLHDPVQNQLVRPAGILLPKSCLVPSDSWRVWAFISFVFPPGLNF